MKATALTTAAGLGRPRARFKGTVVAPGDAGWGAARQAFNLARDQRPALAVFPVDAEDVASAVRFARERGLRLAPQRSGHGADPLGPLDETVLLKTDVMQGVEIDAEARRDRVRAGAKWVNVVPQASEIGLAALHGSSPDIGIVGYSVSGGMGWYARKHGLATNSVTAIEAQIALVTAALADYDVGRYWNFTEEQVGVEAFFPAKTCRRLRAVKERYDPEDLFQGNHSISAAPSRVRAEAMAR